MLVHTNARYNMGSIHVEDPYEVFVGLECAITKILAVQKCANVLATVSKSEIFTLF